MHALIIEDEALIALLIEDGVRALGYTSIDFAATQAEAVWAAAAHCPDLITSDVRLPEGCGIAAVEAICAERDIPVLFITATVWTVRERLGDAAILAKPFTCADLRRALAAAAPAPAA
jgi:CheY-like chemotaxis protein